MFARTAVNFILCFFILDIPNEIKSESCESKEQKPEMACHSHGMREQTNEQLENESTKQTNARPATDSKVSASKTRSRTGRKSGPKKLSAEAIMLVLLKKDTLSQKVEQ